MKRILPIALALAFAGTILSGCDRNTPNNRPAGSGSTATPSTPPSGSTAEQPKKPTQPAPSSPSGSTSGSGTKP